MRYKSLLCTAVDLTLIFIAYWFIVVNNLGADSFRVPDEIFEVGAAQEMPLYGNWFNPTVNKQAFFDKPPLKMWLSNLLVSFVGQSNFSYRLLDALFGLGTLLLTYFLAIKMYGQRIVALVAVFAFLGCTIFVIEHGMRTAVQDSLLVFFTTAVMFSAWQMFASKGKHWAIFAGTAGALAALTKSAAALMPFIVFALFLLLNRRFTSFVKDKWPQLLLGGMIFIVLGSSYFVGHCMFTEGACGSMLYHHVFKRVHGGIHDVSGPEFYLIRIFVHRATFPPELLVASISFGLYQWLKHKKHNYSLLVVWSITPVALYSYASTKLSWYIAPALPAMAILIAATLHEAFQARKKFRTLICLLTIYCGLSLTYNYYKNFIRVSAIDNRIAIDLVTEEILNHFPDGAKIVNFRAPNFALDEFNYKNMLLPQIEYVNAEQNILEKLSESSADFLFTDLYTIREIATQHHVAQYSFLAPIRDRIDWLAVLSFSKTPVLDNFSQAKEIIDFGSSQFRSMYGFGGPEKHNGLPVRYIIGEEAAFLLTGDAARELLGVKVAINLAPTIGEHSNPLQLTLRTNGKIVADFTLDPSSMQTYEFNIAPGYLIVGDNALQFELKLPNKKITRGTRAIMMNWISIRLDQTD